MNKMSDDELIDAIEALGFVHDDEIVIAVTGETGRRLVAVPQGSARWSALMWTHLAFVELCLGPEAASGVDYLLPPELVPPEVVS